MQWFHHECSAKYDFKLQALGAKHGPTGIGVYWMLLEEIGAWSDTFCLKVTGFSAEAERRFSEACQQPLPVSGPDELFHERVQKIPRLSTLILARTLYLTPTRLKAILSTSVEVGLFDQAKWLDLGVLYSRGFERRAERYTRRIQRGRKNVLLISAPCADTLLTEAWRPDPQ